VTGRRRRAALDLSLLFGLALAGNGIAAHFITLPGYVDAYYYTDGAVQLAHGQGFTEPYRHVEIASAAEVSRWCGSPGTVRMGGRHACDSYDQSEPRRGRNTSAPNAKFATQDACQYDCELRVQKGH